MKTRVKITDPLPVLTTVIRQKLFTDDGSNSGHVGFGQEVVNFFGRHLIVRKIFLLFFLASFTGKAVAPDTFELTIFEAPAIRPFVPLMNAIAMVETMGNTLAFNEFENAAGIFQIRQIRVDDYNRRTGSHYQLTDMFDYEISEKVFLYFAELAGPYSFEKIAKAWNGSGPKTEFYWQRIKSLLQ